jgi:hypothetical protein
VVLGSGVKIGTVLEEAGSGTLILNEAAMSAHHCCQVGFPVPVEKTIKKTKETICEKMMKMHM